MRARTIASASSRSPASAERRRRPRRPGRRRTADDRSLWISPGRTRPLSPPARPRITRRHDPGHRRRRLHRLQPAGGAGCAAGMKPSSSTGWAPTASGATSPSTRRPRHPAARAGGFLDSQPAGGDGVPPGRHQRDHRARRRPDLGDQCRAAAAVWHWCAAREVRLVYASSAATYGDGAAGFDDDFSLAALGSCGRSTSMAGPSMPSTCGWRAPWPTRRSGRRNGSG